MINNESIIFWLKGEPGDTGEKGCPGTPVSTLFVCPPVCLPVCQADCPPVCLLTCLSAFPPVDLSLLTCMYVNMSVCQHVCQAVILSSLHLLF